MFMFLIKMFRNEMKSKKKKKKKKRGRFKTVIKTGQKMLNE